MRKLKGSWLTYYLDYTKEHEAPESFHLWTGIALISCVLRRNIVLDMGLYQVHPNMYVVQVATTGECRKTAGANIGFKLLMKLNKANLIGHKINIVKQSATAEGLIMRMQDNFEVRPDGRLIEDGSVFIYAPELRVFLSEGKAKDLIPLLTDFYDCLPVGEYTTRGRKVETINNPCTGILACSTPKWLSKCIAEDAQAGGLTSRIFFIVEAKGRRNLKPERDAALEELLIEDLAHIAKLYGEVRFEDDAYEYFDDWYQNRELSQQDDEMAGWDTRLHTHIMKLATILSVSESDSLRINKQHIDAAMLALKQVEEKMPQAFVHVGATREAEIGEKIHRHLERAEGWLGHSVLLRSIYKFVKDGDEFRKLMGALEEREAIKMAVTQKGIFYALKKFEGKELPAPKKEEAR